MIQVMEFVKELLFLAYTSLYTIRSQLALKKIAMNIQHQTV